MSASLSPSLADLQARFLAILPRIQSHGLIYFRHLKCPHRREEAVAEMVAVAWKWCIRLIQKGKDPGRFPSAIASFAARAVSSGRRLCGQEKPKDVLSPVRSAPTQLLGRRTARSLDLGRQPISEALIDNTQTPVPDQVSFRCDFPAWIKTRTHRDRRVIEELMTGERTLDVASKHGLSPARVSQLRRAFKLDWEQFCEPAVG